MLWLFLFIWRFIVFFCLFCLLFVGVLLVSVLFVYVELFYVFVYIDDSVYLVVVCQCILLLMFEQRLGSLCYFVKFGDFLIIQVESSDFQCISDYCEICVYLEKLVVVFFGCIVLCELFECSVEGYLMLLVIVFIEVDKFVVGLKCFVKLILLVEVEIYFGEVNGKDVMFMLLCDMSVVDCLFVGLLEKINLLFILVVNVDGDLCCSVYGWINQNGLQEIGWWVNGCNFNFNCDFIKFDSVEICNVVWVFNYYELSFFVDIYFIDGVMYFYDSFYCYNGNGWLLVSSVWMDQVMCKLVYQVLESFGYMVYECISLNDNQDLIQGYYFYCIDLVCFFNQYGDICNVLLIFIE